MFNKYSAGVIEGVQFTGLLALQHINDNVNVS